MLDNIYLPKPKKPNNNKKPFRNTKLTRVIQWNKWILRKSILNDNSNPPQLPFSTCCDQFLTWLLGFSWKKRGLGKRTQRLKWNGISYRKPASWSIPSSSQLITPCSPLLFYLFSGYPGVPISVSVWETEVAAAFVLLGCNLSCWLHFAKVAPWLY